MPSTGKGLNLIDILVNAHPISKCVFGLLVLSSVLSIGVIIERMIVINRARRSTELATQQLDEWTSTNNNATRVANIKNGTGLNAPFYLKPTGSDKTTADDQAKDSMTGGSSRDWFFRKNSGANKDVLTDALSSEEFSNF